ncbi:MAG: tetraacyldisaccharide 4'-kinase, partial [Armatimonadetes bacterium]|nr:tetraacyldisaccharide 4'-kinase [Armatimonadota bacterium]
ICILTRGYGRTDPKTRVVVSDGSTVRAQAEQSGDEPRLLAEKLKGIAAVISDADRGAAGKWAIETLGTDVFVLDDGFQHLQLARDLNILAVDATNPWGGGHLLPYGRMREGSRGLKRADCVVITRTEQTDDYGGLQEEIRKLSGDRPIVVSQMQSKGFRRIDSGTTGQVESLPGPVAAFCGVGNPQSFFTQLSKQKPRTVLTRAFPDHHRYDRADIESLSQEAKRLGAKCLVATAKDAVKLTNFSFDLPCFVLEIEISIEEDEKLLQLIQAAITKQ